MKNRILQALAFSLAYSRHASRRPPTSDKARATHDRVPAGGGTDVAAHRGVENRKNGSTVHRGGEPGRGVWAGRLDDMTARDRRLYLGFINLPALNPVISIRSASDVRRTRSCRSATRFSIRAHRAGRQPSRR